MLQKHRLTIFGPNAGSRIVTGNVKALTDDHVVKTLICSNGGETLILYTEKNGASTELVSVNCSEISQIPGQGESEFFKSREISDIFSNNGQNFAIEKCGKVYAWGSNERGQLGVDADAFVSVPLCLPLPTKETVVQVACGKSHSLILAKYGNLYAMGDNTHGQLGLNLHHDEKKTKYDPTLVQCLQGTPISQIVAGKWHSLCVTMSGRVLSWGRNNFGQLGLGTTNDGCTPKQVKDFFKPVAYISAGDDHSAILTRAGELFTFGLGVDGQLGHGETCKNELLPKVVAELEGSVVTQVACGKCHTLVYVPGCGRVFTFGCNKDGQLGFEGTKQKTTVPTMLSYLCSDDQKTFKVEQIFASGKNTCIVHTSSDRLTHDCRFMKLSRSIWTLDDIAKVLANFEKGNTDQDDVIEQLKRVMGSVKCLNGSFQTNDDCTVNYNFHGIDFTVARPAIKQISRACNNEMKKAILAALIADLLPSLEEENEDIETLRLYVILPMCFEIFLKNWMKIPEDLLRIAQDSLTSVVLVFIEKFLKLVGNSMSIVKNWYTTLSSEELLFSVKLCKRAILDLIGIHHVEDLSIFLPDQSPEYLDICYPLQLLKFLEDINSKFEIVSYKEFYIPNLPFSVLGEHYIFWTTKRHLESVLCSYPFLLDAKAKNILLQVDTSVRNIKSLMGPVKPNVLTIDRKNPSGVMLPAKKDINQFFDLQRPLRVRFVGEEGIDDGALAREFFMLVFKEILNKKSSRINCLFTENEGSKLLWFSKHQPKSKLYKFIGKLCGLSVYNNVTAYINFPLALYKKLLDVEPNLDDLKELDPQFGSSLRQILDFPEEKDKTVEKVFDLVFTTTEGYPLKKGGKEIPVTVNNRAEYVSLYVDYVFRRSVKLQFDAFCCGFLQACEAKILHLFRPEELKEMIAGVQDYNWDELKQSTKYQPLECTADGFDALHPTIQWFWEILRDMSPQEKQKFLLFLTGSDKIPLTGLHMTILQREECDDFLPVAYVCYNYLSLHSYSSKEILKERLTLAVQCREYHIK